MDRPSWKAYVRLGMVSIPIQAFTAAKPEREHISLHQLHQGHARIQYHKFCPEHGEVPNDEIVKGFEYAKGEYVVLDPEEIEKIQTDGDRSIDLHSFVPPEEIDPLYFSGKSWYLMPDGQAGRKAYGLLQEAMAKRSVVGIGTIVLGGRQQLVVLRPVDHILTISGLEYQSELRDASEFTGDLDDQDLSSKELKLTESLIEATTDEHFDAGQFHDDYEEKLHELIEAKVAGKNVAFIPHEKLRPVINMMDALRESLAQAKRTGRRKPDAEVAAGRGRRSSAVPHNRHAARKKA